MEVNVGCRDLAECELDAVVGGGAHAGSPPVGFVTNSTQFNSMNMTFILLTYSTIHEKGWV